MGQIFNLVLLLLALTPESVLPGPYGFRAGARTNNNNNNNNRAGGAAPANPYRKFYDRMTSQITGNIRVDGLTHNMSNKFIQNNLGMSSTYSLFNEPNRIVYRRRVSDKSRKYVLFPDNKYPKGSGHYILLKSFKKGIYGPMRQPLYVAFDLHIKDSTRAMLFNWPKEGKGAQGEQPAAGKPDDLEKGVDVGEVIERSKRKTEDEEEEGPTDVRQPDFSTIDISLGPPPDNEMEELGSNMLLGDLRDEKSEEFNGFWIEPEE